MILLDTNVMSELMRPVPDPRVLLWVNSLDFGAIHVPAIVMAELYYGLECMPGGRRKESVRAALDRVANEVGNQAILPFGEDAARAYGRLMAGRDRAGRPMGIVDAQVAAIALANNAQLATRDGDFADCGIEIVNPWAF
jgi:hypothetical protein